MNNHLNQIPKQINEEQQQYRKDIARVLQICLPFVHPCFLEMSGHVLCDLTHCVGGKSANRIKHTPRFICRYPKGLCYSIDEWDFVSHHQLTSFQKNLITFDLNSH